MKHKKTLQKYLKFLETSNYENLMSLFLDDAIVYSPLYGKVSAGKFYKEVFKDTLESNFTVINMFESSDPSFAAIHFQYDWVLSDGNEAPFEVVDIFKFSEEGKIIELKIIYDSVQTRSAFEKLSSS